MSSPDPGLARAFELVVMIDHPDATELLVSALNRLVDDLHRRRIGVSGSLFPVEPDGSTGDAVWEVSS